MKRAMPRQRGSAIVSAGRRVYLCFKGGSRPKSVIDKWQNTTPARHDACNERPLFGADCGYLYRNVIFERPLI